jgi:hypothetical protein
MFINGLFKRNCPMLRPDPRQVTPVKVLYCIIFVDIIKYGQKIKNMAQMLILGSFRAILQRDKEAIEKEIEEKLSQNINE